LNLPRLSVDIDLNLIGVSDVKDLPAARQVFEEALRTICERERCVVKRVPTSHAGGKLRLRFDSVFGGSQNLEVDINYVSRIPLHGKIVQRSKFPPADLLADLSIEPLEVPTLTLEELAAGKFTALVSRFAARDAFDVFNLLNERPNLLHDVNFRLAFICYVAASRTDIREIKPSAYTLDEREVKDKLIPLLQQPGEKDHVLLSDLTHQLKSTVVSAIAEVTKFTNLEMTFLNSFLEDGEIKAEALTKDPELQMRIRTQPMLLWKQQHIKAKKEKI